MPSTHSFFRVSLYLCLLILSVSLFLSPVAIAKTKKHKKKRVKPPPAPIVLTQSQLFLEAEKAFEQGQLSKFENTLPKLKEYPLYPYLLHKKLSKKVSQHQANSLEIHQFINRYPDSLLSKQLADQWLALQANQKNWHNYLTLYQESDQEEKDHKYQCYGLWAKYQQNNEISELYPALSFWHSAVPQAQSCERVFEALFDKNKLNYHDIWNRIELALKKKQINVAEAAAKYLPFEDKKLFKLWIKIYEQPNLISNALIFDLDNYEKDNLTNIKKLLTYGIIRLIKQDVIHAEKLYPDFIKEYQLSHQQQGEITREFAISLAKKRSPLAADWLNQVPKALQDIEYLSWKIRYALFTGDWATALHALNQLPLQESKQPRWKYWKARALHELDHKSEASTLFQSLFHERHFYGFLAHHHCKHPLPLAIRNFDIEPSSIRYFHHQASIARIKELLKLSRIQQAKREWFYKISLLTQVEKIEAAQFANHMQWHDLAIATLAKTQDQNTLALRFPLAHHPKIMNESKKHDIDPAWVFALTRQESTFIPYAQSHVGATGLMQLMPKTAAEVAKSLKKCYPSKQDLTNPHLNIELGTAYLKNLHGFMQRNPVLATASYNAGPGRIKQWLPPSSISMAADIWIENIPFEETRDYVQNIITYTGIYRSILGKAVDLENMLPDISG